MDFPENILRKVVKDRFWLEELRRENSSRTVDYVVNPISYSEFLEKYLLPNRTCILGSWATEGWKSRKKWITSDGKPDLEHLTKEFGSAIGPVANCGEEKYDAHVKEDMLVCEYFKYLCDYQSSENGSEISEKPCKYLKDWHCQRDFPQYGAYSTPVFFKSDWLNEYWDHCSDLQEKHDDYRFVYIGPKRSWTGFHADVLRSYSWSANICGCKRWIFFPPGEENQVRNKSGHLPSKLEPPHLDLRKHQEITQETGQVIFVASGWYHEVHNQEDTISINHNWINGASVDLCWQHLRQTLADVHNEIQDSRDTMSPEEWAQHSQVMLKCLSGMHYEDFYKFLHVIATRRIQHLCTYEQKLDTSINAYDRNAKEDEVDGDKHHLESASQCAQKEVQLPRETRPPEHTDACDCHSSERDGLACTKRMTQDYSCQSKRRASHAANPPAICQSQPATSVEDSHQKHDLPVNHTVFDLVQISRTLALMLCDQDMLDLKCSVDKESPGDFMLKIDGVIEKWCQLTDFL